MIYGKLVEKLSEYHKTHLLPQFEEDPNEEQSIQVLTDYITKVTIYISIFPPKKYIRICQRSNFFWREIFFWL